MLAPAQVLAGDPQVAALAHVIQLAVAPVFLLSALAAFLNVLTNRLSRVIDRARKIEERFESFHTQEQHVHNTELDTLAVRARLISLAMAANVFSALLICIVVAALFLAASADINIATVTTILFVTAMVCFILALVLFLREVWLGTRAIRIQPQDVRERTRRSLSAQALAARREDEASSPTPPLGL